MNTIKHAEKKVVAAMSTLEQLGYTYHGGELWKPPIAEAIKESEPKEWPQVGEEVVWGAGGVVGEVVFIHELDALIKTENNKFLIPVSKLSKPQSALEEELEGRIDKYLKVELSSPLIRNLTRAIINGEIKGLSYKPE